jgi:hypothetical protein
MDLNEDIIGLSYLRPWERSQVVVSGCAIIGEGECPHGSVRGHSASESEARGAWEIDDEGINTEQGMCVTEII